MRICCLACLRRILSRSRSATDCDRAGCGDGACTEPGGDFNAIDVSSLNNDMTSWLRATGSSGVGGWCGVAVPPPRPGKAMGGTTCCNGTWLASLSKKKRSPSRKPSLHLIDSARARCASGTCAALPSDCHGSRNPQSNGLLSCDTSRNCFKQLSIVSSSLAHIISRLMNADLGR